MKSNLIKNFGLSTKNQNFKPTDFTISTTSTGVTKSINTIGFMSFIENTDAIGFIENIKPIEKNLVLEDITQQLLKNKHTLILC